MRETMPLACLTPHGVCLCFCLTCLFSCVQDSWISFWCDLLREIERLFSSGEILCRISLSLENNWLLFHHLHLALNFHCKWMHELYILSLPDLFNYNNRLYRPKVKVSLLQLSTLTRINPSINVMKTFNVINPSRAQNDSKCRKCHCQRISAILYKVCPFCTLDGLKVFIALIVMMH